MLIHDITGMTDEDLDKAQYGLMAAGMAPGGFVADLADAGISLSRGDLMNAMLGLGAAVPGIGMAVGAGRLAKGAAKAAGDLPDELVNTYRKHKVLEEKLGSLTDERTGQVADYTLEGKRTSGLKSAHTKASRKLIRLKRKHIEGYGDARRIGGDALNKKEDEFLAAMGEPTMAEEQAARLAEYRAREKDMAEGEGIEAAALPSPAEAPLRSFMASRGKQVAAEGESIEAAARPMEVAPEAAARPMEVAPEGDLVEKISGVSPYEGRIPKRVDTTRDVHAPGIGLGDEVLETKGKNQIALAHLEAYLENAIIDMRGNYDELGELPPETFERFFMESVSGAEEYAGQKYDHLVGRAKAVALKSGSRDAKRQKRQLKAIAEAEYALRKTWKDLDAGKVPKLTNPKKWGATWLKFEEERMRILEKGRRLAVDQPQPDIGRMVDQPQPDIGRMVDQPQPDIGSLAEKIAGSSYAVPSREAGTTALGHQVPPVAPVTNQQIGELMRRHQLRADMPRNLSEYDERGIGW